jgi:hypothetical protein
VPAHRHQRRPGRAQPRHREIDVRVRQRPPRWSRRPEQRLRQMAWPRTHPCCANARGVQNPGAAASCLAVSPSGRSRRCQVCECR